MVDKTLKSKKKKLTLILFVFCKYLSSYFDVFFFWQSVRNYLLSGLVLLALKAWFCCDPHITTLDERGYIFNGWGEYTMVNMTTPSLTFVLQARTDLAETETGRLGNATVFTAFGADVNGVRVFVELEPSTKDCKLLFNCCLLTDDWIMNPCSHRLNSISQSFHCSFSWVQSALLLAGFLKTRLWCRYAFSSFVAFINQHSGWPVTLSHLFQSAWQVSQQPVFLVL